MTKASLYRRAKSNNPSVAFPAQVALGMTQVVSPTTETGLRRYGGAGRLFAPAATNVFPDPQGVLADGTFWPASTAHTVATANLAPPIPLPAELAEAGLTKCLQLVNDGTADTPQTATVAVTASKSYFTSVYVYAPTLGGNLTITAEDGHSFTVAALTGALAGWVRYSVYSPTVGGETTLHLHLAFAGGTASTVYLCGAQLVNEYCLTPFFCGLSADCAWSGTVNASTSTRPLTVLRYPVGPMAVNTGGTVIMRFVPLFAENDTTATWCPTTFALKASGACFDSEQGHSCWYAGTGGLVQMDADYVANSLNTVVARWTAATNCDVMVNGVAGTQDASTAAFTPDRIYVGDYGGGGYTWTGWLGPMAFVPGVGITTAEATAASSLLVGGGTAADLAALLRRGGYLNSLVLPLNGDSRGFQLVA